jgi:hypothetical protein
MSSMFIGSTESFSALTTGASNIINYIYIGFCRGWFLEILNMKLPSKNT